MLDEEESEAYGWHTTTTDAGRALIHKGGDSFLYTSQNYYYPGDDITMIWLVNDNRQRWRSLLNRSLSQLIHGEPISTPAAVKSSSGDEYEKITGHYVSKDSGEVSIRPEGDLIIVSGGHLAVPVMLYVNRHGRYTGLNGRTGNWIEVTADQVPGDKAKLEFTESGQSWHYFSPSRFDPGTHQPKKQ